MRTQIQYSHAEAMCTCRFVYSPTPGDFMWLQLCAYWPWQQETQPREENLGEDMRTDRLRWKACYHEKEDKITGERKLCTLSHCRNIISLLLHFLSSDAYSSVWMWNTDNLKCDRRGGKAALECFSYLSQAVAQLHKRHGRFTRTQACV